MANKTPRNPYQDLVNQVNKWLVSVFHPKERRMWFWPAAKLTEGWSLATLNERVIAADQLGFDVVLKPAEHGLEVWYRKRAVLPPGYPFNI